VCSTDAALAKHTEIAAALIGRVDVLRKDKRGWTALHYAADNNRLDVVDMLIQVYIPDADCCPPI